jgi:ABC-type transport system involved in cytochrome bd biosynthesis fused ATPase/permease subunit
MGEAVMQLAWLIVILAPLLVLVMIWAFARNAIAMKRDIDQRFDRLRQRLENDATEAVETLMREKPGKNGSS